MIGIHLTLVGWYDGTTAFNQDKFWDTSKVTICGMFSGV